MRNKLLTKKLFSLLAFIAFSSALFSSAVSAQVAGQDTNFNHMRTGFPLTGVHTTVACETCHVGGVFKGTPTDCASCHSVGRRVVATFKSANHMATTAACDTCHTNTISFLGARFNHIGVQPKACMTCHNGNTAPGKPSGHIVTTLSCDSCHRTSGWLPAGFNHEGTLPACDTCHNGTNAKGKPQNHIPTSAACDSCHKSGFTTFLGAIYSHAGVNPGTCGTCHIPGTYGAKTKPANHIPYTGNDCDSCHVGTGYVSFAGSTMNHTLPAVASMGCSTCHNGNYISQAGFLGGPQGKPANHIATTSECNSSGCHSGFQTFAGLAFDHASASPAVAGRCDQCHNGSQALGKPSTHVVTTAQCDTCHGTANNYTSFAGAAFNHATANPPVATICGTCHLGQTATVVTKGPTHIPTTGNACDDCHNSGTFSSGGFATPAAVMNHSSPAISSFTCITCHSGAYINEKGSLALGAQVQPSGHIVTSATCSNCHHNGFTSFVGGVFDHVSANVLPTTCGTCHLGQVLKTVALSSDGNHIPTSKMSNPNACDSCHTSGYTSFGPGTRTNHAAVPYPTYTCIECHNGGYLSQGAIAKTTTHIPTANMSTPDACNLCHTSGYTAWGPGTKTNHASVTAYSCATCHGGSYASEGAKSTADAKPTHVAFISACNTCHIDTSYTSFIAPLTSSPTMHTSYFPIEPCKTCHANTNIEGVTGSATVGNHENSTSNDDCSQSSCHKPLGNIGTSYISFK